MRSLFLIAIFLAALWLGDLFLFKGRYANELRVAVERMSQDINYAVTRKLR